MPVLVIKKFSRCSQKKCIPSKYFEPFDTLQHFEKFVPTTANMCFFVRFSKNRYQKIRRNSNLISNINLVSKRLIYYNRYQSFKTSKGRKVAVCLNSLESMPASQEKQSAFKTTTVFLVQTKTGTAGKINFLFI